MKRISLTACAAFLLLASSAWAGDPPRIVANRREFSLPVQIDPRDRANVKELQLFVRQLPGNWICQQTVPATQQRFAVTVEKDGEYWFRIVPVELSGARKFDPEKDNPALIVVVDTKPPEPFVQPVNVASGDSIVLCSVRDANPDPATLSVEIQVGENQWVGLGPMKPDMPGAYRLPPQGANQAKLRIRAMDKAGNSVAKVFDLARPGAPGEDQPIASEIVPVVARTVEKPNNLPVNSPVSKIKLQNNPHVLLKYAADGDTTAVARIETWLTRDNGQLWQRIREETGKVAPIDLDLPGEGVFGLVVFVTPDGGTPAVPTSGEAPDWTFEIDSTPPEILLSPPQLLSEGDASILALSWSVRDKNLTPDSVTVNWSATKTGPWQPIGTGLRTEGTYRWPVPADVGSKVFLRVTAVDRAGNLGTFITPQPVSVEGAHAKPKLFGLNPRAIR